MNNREIIIQEFEGKEIYHCYAMGSRINYNMDSISLCHGIEIGDQIISKTISSDQTADWYYGVIRSKLEEVQSPGALCHKCSNLKRGVFHLGDMEVITINTSRFCNSKCVYCPAHTMYDDSSYDPLPLIRDFMDAGVVAEDCLFDWGGGEPVINKYFEQSLLFLNESGFRQRINTNCIKFSESLCRLLADNRCEIRTSLDAGNRQTFFRVKGVDQFDEVCKNIRKYNSENPGRVIVKYVLNNSNSNRDSIEGFFTFCREAGIGKVCLDAELNAFAMRDYRGPLFYTEKENEAARLFLTLARESHIPADVGYIYSAGTDLESRDFNTSVDMRYEIPREIPKQELKEIFAGGIGLRTYASLDSLLYAIGTRKAILLGSHNISRFIRHILKKNKVDVTHKIGVEEGEKLRSVLRENPGSVVVLANKDYYTSMRLLNQLDLPASQDVYAMENHRYIQDRPDYERIVRIYRKLKKMRMIKVR